VLEIATGEEKDILAPLLHMNRMNKLPPVEREEVMRKLAAAGLM
jgi:hypothetical protein